ncbi:stage VI sporulation protein F [Brevibacillus sp. B_LB10_24]|uniref:stage VI sporulation protein F n=1 Tax=Brevibacillus sp. B_LB10_24 TaxID=3380645 RepID=UPI0038B8AA59
MGKNFSRRLFEKLQTSGLSNIDENGLRAIAGSLTRSDFEDESKLRQLIQTLSAISGTPVSTEKEEKILQMFREKQVDMNDLQSLGKLLK